MRPTLLIDLDDTLLSNEIGAFLPAYLQALSRELASYAEPNRLVGTLLAATRLMVENQQPDHTLKEIFDKNFFPALGLKSTDVQGSIDKFYAEVFPTLKKLTRPIPEAIGFVEQAFERGYRLVIATNPLFPRTAILQRLEWAGLPVERYPFDLVVSYERFHFAKPQTAFFAEIMAHLGWPDGPVIMVGDSLENDLLPASQIGMATFWNPPSSPEASEKPEAVTATGKLGELLPWMEKLPPESITPNYGHPPAILATLRATPAWIDTLSRAAPPLCWDQRPVEGEWAPVEIFCHLRDVEGEVNLPRLQKIIQEENPVLPWQDTDRWAEERGYSHQDGFQALKQFIAFRLQVLNLLETIKPEDWGKSARHAKFGPTQLAELAGIMAGHDRLHIQQLLKFYSG